MSAPVPDLTSLLRQTHISSDEEFLIAANAALKKTEADTIAQRTRAVALLKLNRYSEATKVFDDAGQQLKDLAPLEYAYALYKTGDLEQARKVAEKHGQENIGLAHLAGQIVSCHCMLGSYTNAGQVLSHGKLPRRNQRV